MEEFEFEKDESIGTQRFFGLAGCFLEAIAHSFVLVIDELECSLHPLLTRKLVELFQASNAGVSGAQLIFTTQDSNLMDEDLLRRDQIWMAQKRTSGATELFSLYDLQERPRTTEAFERNYLLGRYGGVPNFGPSLEDLELK